MQLSIKGLAWAAALLWGGLMFFVGLVHLFDPSYGLNFLDVMGSVYPGFHVAHSVWDWILGTVYGFVDGGIAGLIFAWIYNFVGGHTRETQAWHGTQVSSPAPAK
jgi:hypothetical protein